MVGEFDLAVPFIQHSLVSPAGPFASDLPFDPVWEPIRVDPRILELLEQSAVVVHHLPPPTAPEATL